MNIKLSYLFFILRYKFKSKHLVGIKINLDNVK